MGRDTRRKNACNFLRERVIAEKDARRAVGRESAFPVAARSDFSRAKLDDLLLMNGELTFEGNH